MIKLSDIKPGRIYSFVYSAPVEMVQKKRTGEVNPMFDLSVRVVRSTVTQAAGSKTYGNRMRKIHGTDWQPSDRKPWCHVSPENSCVMVHNTTGVEYLRGLPIKVQGETYLVGSQPATEAQTETIRLFKKGSGGDAPEFVLYKLENISNLLDDGGQDE